MAKRNENATTTPGGRDRIAMILYVFYVLFLLASLVLIVRIIQIQCTPVVPASLESNFKPSTRTRTVDPERGSIIARDGRLLAVSTPMYQIYMDCTVQKDAYADDAVKGPERERAWREKARGLAEGLAGYFGDKTAEQYYSAIINGRNNNTRYMRIGRDVDHDGMLKVSSLPLFNEGRNTGGIIIQKKDTRQYPYGTLARRTIGYVKDNSNSNGNNHIGLEGKYDYILHGKEGIEYLRRTENNEWIQNYDSTSVKPVDGQDVRTTLDIDIQDIADKALRKQIEDDPDLEGGCCVILDVETAAVRGMVNLLRDTTSGALNESLNMAISRKGEPGSVFKTTTLMTVLEDGIIHSLDDEIPTNRGRLAGWKDADVHITDWEREHNATTIPIIEGYKVSSNYMFRYLAVTYYQNQPEKFMDKLYMYKMGQAFDFDLEGFATPSIPSVSSPDWSRITLGQVAMGYAVSVTPLHIVTFYNAIANKGKMMKPYLVEDIRSHGSVKKKLGPSVLNASICSKATADTITRGLRAIVEDGTAKRLRNCKWDVGGKTGTSWVVLSPNELKGSTDPYSDKYGRKKYQGTFVCFFPTDKPKYTAIVTMYSKVSSKAYYGGTKPALAMADIVDGLYALDLEGGREVSGKGSIPQMAAAPAPDTAEGTVPDLRGMGLKDALALIENSGYNCAYEGIGHVVSQSPKAGQKAPEGSTVTIRLKQK